VRNQVTDSLNFVPEVSSSKTLAGRSSDFPCF